MSQRFMILGLSLLASAIVGCGASLGASGETDSTSDTPLLALYCETEIEGVDLGFDDDVTGGSHVCPYHVIDHSRQHYASIELVDVRGDADVVYSERLRQREEGGMFLDWSLVATVDGRVLERQTETDPDFSFSRETLHRRLQSDFNGALRQYGAELRGEDE